MKRLVIITACLLSVFFADAQVPAKPSADSIAIKKTVLSFYNWYNVNWQKLNDFKLYTNVEKRNPPYKINWKEVERYIGYLRRTLPQFGEAFINHERQFFKRCDSAFKTTLTDEVPYGFDYDRFTNSQEDPKWLLEELKKSKQWITTVTGNDAKVDVLGYFMDGDKKVETVVMCFVMKKEKGKWTIAEIGCTFADPVQGD